MFKYLKKWFHEAIIQGQQFVGRNFQTAVREEMENEGNSLNPIESCELPRPTIKKKSGEKSEEKNCDKVMKNIRGKILRYYAKRVCDVEKKKKREMIVNNGKKTREEKNVLADGETCRCKNCSIVAEMSECVVCLESMQNRGIRSCQICANLVCSKCADKLKKCPFCRSSIPLQNNRAIERLLGEFFIPCKNSRSGCRKMLNSETRLWHEAVCDHTSVGCPISKTCCWNGSPNSILGHLKKAHKLKPLEDHGIVVEISSFRQKTMTKEGEYTIYLSCYGQLFAIKVTLSRQKLNLSFSQLGYITLDTKKIAKKKYGVWMKLRVAGKRIRGVLPFGKFDRETRDIEINCEKLFSKLGGVFHPGDDDVKIEISIRELIKKNV